MADQKPTVIKTGSSNVGLIFLGLAVIVAAVVAFIMFQSESKENDAVSGAASAVSDAAKDVGDAAKSETK